MDASAILRKQGWQGTGHSLDTTGRGIKRPLLISHKQDQLGLGTKKAAHKADDQWWMRAFDESLANIGSGKESTLSQVRTKGINRGGLYGFFVKGEGLAGTVKDSEESSVDEAASKEKASTTPPTSQSESETGEIPVNDASMAKKNKKDNKRKRDCEEDALSKKQKQDAVSVSLPKETIFGPLGAVQIAKINTLAKKIRNDVQQIIKVDDRKGVFGLDVPTKTSAKKSVIYVDRLTGKNFTYKAAKYERQSRMRTAKEAGIKKNIVKALVAGDIPNQQQWTEEEALTNWPKIHSTLESLDKIDRIIRKEANQVLKEARHYEIRRFADGKRAAEQALISEAERARQHQKAARKIANLTPGDKKQLEARAASKHQTLDVYILRRIEKGADKKALRDAEEKSAKSAKKAKKAQAIADGTSPDAMLVVDTEGDSSLLTKAAALAPITYEALEDGSCPLEPSIWEGHNVKHLPKEVRKARCKWLEQQRNKRKIATGKSIEPKTSRSEIKKKKMQRLMGEVLKEQGIRSGATNE
jgi:hypothetical protein